MDTYDGLAWGVANAAPAVAFGGFQRVGTLLPGAIAGAPRTATITIQPAYDAAVAARPGRTPPASPSRGGRRRRPRAALRFNVATTTGIIPDEVPAGLSYTVSAAAVPAPAPAALGTPARTARRTCVDDHPIPPAVQAFAQRARGDGEHADGQGPRAGRLPA